MGLAPDPEITSLCSQCFFLGSRSDLKRPPSVDRVFMLSPYWELELLEFGCYLSLLM